MAPKYDFLCEREHRFEVWADRDQRTATCDFCGAPAQRELSVVRLPTINGKAMVPKSQKPVPIGEYEEAGAQLQYEFDRYKDSTQQENLRDVDLWTPALKAANEVLAGKRKPPAGYEPVSFT